jgi:hypothetical protein
VDLDGTLGDAHLSQMIDREVPQRMGCGTLRQRQQGE